LTVSNGPKRFLGRTRKSIKAQKQEACLNLPFGINSMAAAEARRIAAKQKKKGYGSIASARRAVAVEVALIRKGSWVRRRRNGGSPQFGTAKQKAAARSLRSAYRSWL
jgi:hypothetical protein